MKRLLFLALTGALLATAVTGDAYAGDRDNGSKRRHVRYLESRDVVIIRDYYRPYYRPLPRGVRHVYYRNGYLPYGWAARMRPVPVHVVRRLHPLPYGYSRGIIDGHLVVHNTHGLIVDVAVLF